MWDDEESDPTIMQHSYYIGLRTHTFDHPDAGKPYLDFFLEIPPSTKLCAEGCKLLGNEGSSMLVEAKEIEKEVVAIRLRTRYNHIVTCLFHSPIQLTREQMTNLVQSLGKERLMEARCLL